MSFLKIPQKIHHGLVLITDLAEVYESDSILSLEEIAKKEKISQGFLEEIASSLRKAGLINGTRGAGGGYSLSKNPKEISVADVVVAIDGPVAMVDCLSLDKGCVLEGQCSTRNVWGGLQEKMLQTLKLTTIDEIVTNAKVKTKIDL